MKIVQDSKGRFAKGNNTSGSGAGRPRKVDEKIVQKLEEGFMMGYNDSEACLYAEIAKGTLYDYIKENPNFGTKKEELKKHPGIRAKANLLHSINSGDVNDSKWYLERRNRDEFSLKIETDNKTEISGTLETVDISKMTSAERLEYIKTKCK